MPRLTEPQTVTLSESDPRGPRVGELIRAARSARRLSLGVLGDMVGCTKSYLSAIENGRKGPPGEALLEGLEQALGLSDGALRDAARWETTPADIRARYTELELERDNGRAVARRLRQLISARGGLDRAHESGELARLIGAIDPATGDADLRPASLPLEVPLINSVAAGYPREFTDLGYPARCADEYVRVPDLADADAFAARVVGDSMAPDYREGDVVVFSPARGVRDGDDCFARIEPDHETTFKRVYFERDGGRELIRLQPINSAYAPRVLERERVAGLYSAVSVTRRIGG